MKLLGKLRDTLVFDKTSEDAMVAGFKVIFYQINFFAISSSYQRQTLAITSSNNNISLVAICVMYCIQRSSSLDHCIYFANYQHIAGWVGLLMVFDP